MLLDLDNEKDRQKFIERTKNLIDQRCVVELKKKVNRTPKQNRYLHLILGWFAIETGYTLDQVKTNFFKMTVNPDIFVTKVMGKLGQIDALRSTSELSTVEKTKCIEKFRTWSSVFAGVYLPEANEDKFLKHIEIQIDRQREYL